MATMSFILISQEFMGCSPELLYYQEALIQWSQILINFSYIIKEKIFWKGKENSFLDKWV